MPHQRPLWHRVRRPFTAPATRSYLVVAAPRSGTGLLCEALRWHGLGRPQEYLGPESMPSYARRWGVGDPSSEPSARRAYRDRMLHAGTTANGVFGAKLLYVHLDPLLALAGAHPHADPLEVLGRFLPDPRIVHLRRGDKVRAAVSLVRAQESGRWARRRWQRRDRPRALDLASITRAHAEHHAEEERWDAVLSGRPGRVVVDFDELIVDPHGAVAAVADLLDVGPVRALPAVARWGLPAPQSDAHTEQAVRRWVDEVGGCVPCGHPA